MSDQPAGPEVTLVSAVLLREGMADEHRVLQDHAVETARRGWGLTRAELIAAVPGVQDDTVALMTFRSRTDLDRWLASDERREILGRMSRLTRGGRRTNVLSGFPGWFATGPIVPARWKQAIAVIIGLVPVSFVVTALREWWLPELPLLASVVVTSVANVCALTWFIMPKLNDLLSTWLSPAGTQRIRAGSGTSSGTRPTLR